MTAPVRVALPAHLRTLAAVEGEVALAVAPPVTIGAVLDALKARFPMLRGTVRDHGTQRRRAFVRFFVDGEDWSHEPPDRLLPPAVAEGREPFVIIGAIAGGGKGAAIGAATGAGAAGAVQVLTKGPKVQIPSETRLTFTLTHALVL